jgi:AcrR family transcriptional regulator
MASKDDWIKVGCEILVESGADGLTIEALTGRLGVTKGSFYHHFKSYEGFKRAFLDSYEQQGTLYIIEAAERRKDTRAKFEVILRATLHDPPDVEVALRAWALRDPLVAEYQGRIDTRRLGYVLELCRALVPDSTQAQRMAQMIFAVYLGSQHMTPPLAPDAVRGLYNDILQFYIGNGSL